VQHPGGTIAVDEGVEGGQVVRAHPVVEGGPQAAEGDLGVTAGRGRQRGRQVDGELALTQQGEAGLAQPRGPVRAEMRQLAGQFPGQDRVAALFEPGTGLGGQEARERAKLLHGQQSAGAQCGEDVGQDALGIGHVVQRLGRPHQVNGLDSRPARVQVRLEDVHPVGHAEITGLVLQAAKQRRRGVHRGHLGAGEALRQGQRACAGAGAQVENPARRTGRGVGDPADHLGQIGMQDLCVQVQHLGHGRVVLMVGMRGVGRGGGMVVGRGGGMVTVVRHDPTLRRPCHYGIASCV
jgi:hypothetical protein